MAKITPLGVEIKCRKCKRIQLIPNSQVSFEGGDHARQSGRRNVLDISSE
jgi:hypothetical protein